MAWLSKRDAMSPMRCLDRVLAKRLEVPNDGTNLVRLQRLFGIRSL